MYHSLISRILFCDRSTHIISTAYFVGIASVGHLYMSSALLCISVLDAFVIPRLARLVFAVSLFGACLIVWIQGESRARIKYVSHYLIAHPISQIILVYFAVMLVLHAGTFVDTLVYPSSILPRSVLLPSLYGTVNTLVCCLLRFICATFV